MITISISSPMKTTPIGLPYLSQIHRTMRRKVLIATPSKCPMRTVVRQRILSPSLLPTLMSLGTVTLNPPSGLRVGGTVTATLTDEDASPAQLAAASWQWEMGTRQHCYFWRNVGFIYRSRVMLIVKQPMTLTVTANYTDSLGGKSRMPFASIGSVFYLSN